MFQLLAIAIGGALGSVGRFWVSGTVNGWLGRPFPYGTLTVNVIGSGVMGILFIVLAERLTLAPAWRAALLVGLLGGFTTFSSCSMETVRLLEQQRYGAALLNIGLNVVLCVTAAGLGVVLARRWLG